MLILHPNSKHLFEQLINWDKSLLLHLNGMHTDFWDIVMFQMSNKFIWLPLYVFLLYLVIRDYRLRTIDVLISIALLITISDFSSVHLFKEIFQRLRPCHDSEIKPLLHLVYNECGGLYSFVSSHAANTFALTFFLITVMGKKVKYLTAGMVVWASIVSYSRIYLGAHYPLDVLCGAVLGIATGTLLGKLFMWYYSKFVAKENRQPI